MLIGSFSFPQVLTSDIGQSLKPLAQKFMFDASNVTVNHKMKLKHPVKILIVVVWLNVTNKNNLQMVGYLTYLNYRSGSEGMPDH